MHRNQWLASVGITGWDGSESPAGLRRITQTLPAPERIVEMPRALHAAGGNYMNYFHWLLDIIPRLQVAPFAANLSDRVVLLPPLETRFQRDTAALLMDGPNSLYVMGKGFSVHARSLRYVPNMTGGGFIFNPNLRAFFDAVRDALHIPPAVPTRRLYLTRRDSRIRVMNNEADVETLVERHGFDVVELTGMSLRDQVSLFASASHIVAAHGAALANIVFCTPGAHLCELIMSNHLNSCYRCLAVMQQLHYGCIVEPSNQDTGVWNTPLDRLEAVLSNFARQS